MANDSKEDVEKARGNNCSKKREKKEINNQIYSNTAIPLR